MANKVIFLKLTAIFCVRIRCYALVGALFFCLIPLLFLQQTLAIDIVTVFLK